MKKIKKKENLRGKSKKELYKILKQKRFKFEEVVINLDKAKNKNKHKNLKREIAVLLTIIKEKEMKKNVSVEF